MQNKNVIIVIVALIVVLGIGYCIGANTGYGRYEMSDQRAQSEYGRQIPNGMHMMPNGQMMGNGPASNTSMDMQDMMASMNSGLVGKTGDAFDQAFLAEMIVHHQGAVEMAKAALVNAKHQEIKDLANGIITAQNKEIAEMQQWQKAWYGR